MSKLFTKTQKNLPADETARNAQLLIKAGFVHKEMAGVYAYLPLGLKVLENIKQVIREEMDAIGGQEIMMTALQPRELWEKTDRWDDNKVDNWFKTTLVNGSEVGLGITHEEPLTNMMRAFVNSYKDLPAYPYQFQTKFRNELRAKSGLMRGREFLMKDLYSFSQNEEEHFKFYAKVEQAYRTIFERLQISEITYKTYASGGIFSKFSHEFQTLSEVGEDTIYVHTGENGREGIAINKEVINSPEILAEIGLPRDAFEEKRGVEVGNIFTLNTKFSEPLDLYFTNEKGERHPVIMGSYGIGPSRLLGLLVEHFADDRGLVWPKDIAPYQVYLVQIGEGETIHSKASKLAEKLEAQGISVLHDDRDIHAGEKFADADLIGLPHRVVVSERLGDSFEYKGRLDGEAIVLTEPDLFAKIN